ncbi:MAG: WecB/TagA/CpsF family glycosyltransferase, partial [Mycobacterium sp.]|nr:WecB/TagA/CpsF family glycosyltransferase [Mycobacterium sp.]
MTASEALDEISDLFRSPVAATVMIVNAHSLNLAARCSAYRTALGSAALVLNDGAGLELAARIQGRRFPANLNGTDLIPEVLGRCADENRSVFLYGARPGVAERAAQLLLAAMPALVVAGTADGYTLDAEEVSEKVRASGADLLLVALGNPRQELWLTEHLQDTGARVGIGVGAFFDFAAGEVARAPDWMRRARLEWLHRLVLEPHRLFRRYVLGNP